MFTIFSILRFSTKSVEDGYYVSELTLINVELCKYINIRPFFGFILPDLQLYRVTDEA